MTAIVVIGVLAVVLIIVLSMFSAEKRRKRLLARTPRTLIAHATSGVAKIQGRLAHCWPPLQAPISGRPCAAYQVKVLTYEGGKELLLLHEIKGQPFLLHDESGRGLIHYDEQTVLILKKDVEDTSRTMKDPTPMMAALLQRHGVPATRILGLNRGLRYQEAVLEEGELVTAHGIVSREPDPDPAAAHQNMTWAVMRAAPGTDLTLTDELPLDQPPQSSAGGAPR